MDIPVPVFDRVICPSCNLALTVKTDRQLVRGRGDVFRYEYHSPSSIVCECKTLLFLELHVSVAGERHLIVTRTEKAVGAGRLLVKK